MRSPKGPERHVDPCGPDPDDVLIDEWTLDELDRSSDLDSARTAWMLDDDAPD